MTSDIAVLDGAGSGAIRTARLQLLEMPGLLVSAILQKNWPAAEHLLGTPFPREWRDDGWRWLEPQLKNGEADERFIAWGTRLALPKPSGPGVGFTAARAYVHPVLGEQLTFRRGLSTG